MNARVKNAQLENSLKNTILISGTTVVNPILIYYYLQVSEVQSPTLDTGKVLRKILLHPGQLVLPRHIYRDCRGLDAEGALVRMNELVEGLGSLVQGMQQQKVFYKALPTLDIEDSLRSHRINPDEYHAQFFEVDYEVIESQRNAIHNANPDRELIPLLDENHENEIEEIYSSDDNNSNDDYDGDDENSGGNNGESSDDGNGEANSVNNDASDGGGDETSNDNGTGGDSGDNGGGDESSDKGSGENEIVNNESDDNESGDHASNDNGNGSSIDDDNDDGRRCRNWAE